MIPLIGPVFRVQFENSSDDVLLSVIGKGHMIYLLAL
jgi:hypothetical protein